MWEIITGLFGLSQFLAYPDLARRGTWAGSYYLGATVPPDFLCFLVDAEQLVFNYLILAGIRYGVCKMAVIDFMNL